jgi:hypothetical protein
MHGTTIKEKVDLFARRKTSSENTVFETSSGVCSEPRLLPRSCHGPVLTLSFYRIVVFHLPNYTLQRKRQFFTYKLHVQT